MLKSQLIRQLQEIPGDPVIFVDLDGKFSDDIKPVHYTANQQALASLLPTNQTPLELGEKYILI
jgi:hypothetical protein